MGHYTEDPTSWVVLAEFPVTTASAAWRGGTPGALLQRSQVGNFGAHGRTLTVHGGIVGSVP